MSSVIAWGRLLPDRVDLCMQSADVAEQRPFRHVDIEHRDEADELDRDGVSERQGVQKAEAGCVGLVLAEDDRLPPADEARQQLRGNALVGQLAQHRREQPIELVAVPRDISKGRRRTSLMSTSVAEKGRIRPCTRSRVGTRSGCARPVVHHRSLAVALESVDFEQRSLRCVLRRDLDGRWSTP